MMIVFLLMKQSIVQMLHSRFLKALYLTLRWGKYFLTIFASLLSTYFANSLLEETVECDFSLCAIAIHIIFVFEGLCPIVEDESWTLEEISSVTEAKPQESIFTSEKKKQSYLDAKQVFDLLFQEALTIYEGCLFHLWRAYPLCQFDLKAINASAGCFLSIYSEDSKKMEADLIYLLFYQYFQPP
ncbi:hypothetical protein O6H91_16G015000 [Diphasiastrum complanatum]|uniref:Uncharacterized protein n=1 Tax=Diphasiastrum complanatum TaxID=34168 RepID=A0ACC2BA12_DIPCM|nr:hypothetical protein O6H91_16G015000 [Diphasiastrum complanatum]